MVLQEQRVGFLSVARDLMHALAVLGETLVLGHELGADACVGRPPRLASVVALVDTAGRDRNRELAGITFVEHDRVQAQAAAARLPGWSMRMVPQASHQLKALPAVC